MYTETNVPQTEEHLFTEQDVLAYQEASTSQRFCNFLIDGILVQYAMAFLGGIALGVVLLLTSSEAAADYGEDSSPGLIVITYLMILLLDLAYFTLCEKLFGGRTLGKLITGSKAVREDGTSLTWKDACLRSLSRMVPFEPFSALGGAPWHDRWTKTTVVRTR
jgi:uncharacterized RDD family membrane protein YckC